MEYLASGIPTLIYKLPGIPDEYYQYCFSLEDLGVEALANKMMDIILPWIIQYFSQTKTASIDLNRYKLEAFLMTDENIKTNDVICNAIFDSNCYIREHMADIVGEKQLHSGVNNLCRQLTAEENFYTAVSIMEALGKLRNPIALNYILKWIQNNEKKVLSEKQYFVLKHARVALAKLTDDTTEYNLIQFDENSNLVSIKIICKPNQHFLASYPQLYAPLWITFSKINCNGDIIFVVIDCHRDVLFDTYFIKKRKIHIKFLNHRAGTKRTK